ncbi:YtpR family tRNA-binding protein [Mesoplasma lactucae]|uniref:Uncharacterized protein n=1 Tax=Mesoplasma lactucae ATCC 49193 TaxID=81460 RepID=A0A291IS78_9MOLU|nr:hypothetical protein [Mesoplasma lactucae]ATG97566.1 hypothetical protein CP520_02250 [Mesoplasma lactucae ATCC 49193]ATZ19975.1 hypothetical protein MLACT_v1c01530 [Mesoplasma lactucae ATCC 49193]MCL8217074.1 Phenylalanine--tRNA ligase beta subunit [Mesoplasma lactucae ATCC 49193]
MYGVYYNDLFDSLIISKKTIDDYLVDFKDGVTILRDEKTKEITGVNVFNVSKDITLHKAFNSFNPDALDYLKNRLKNYFVFEQQTQFVVAKVLECVDIEGTHLHKCEVDLGNATTQIVCGAKNIANDQLVVVALPYAWMPNGMQIVPSKLRGFDSNGMICSQKELDIDDKRFSKEGIIVLPESFADKIGNDFFTEL